MQEGILTAAQITDIVVNNTTDAAIAVLQSHARRAPSSAPFPRENDGLGYAWGLMEDTPRQIWERFSPDDEAQAEAVWRQFAAMGMRPAIEWGGSQDGEAIIGRDADGEIVLLYHLEYMDDAQALQQAIQTKTLPAAIVETIRRDHDEACRYTRPPGA